MSRLQSVSGICAVFYSVLRASCAVFYFVLIFVSNVKSYLPEFDSLYLSPPYRGMGSRVCRASGAVFHSDTKVRGAVFHSDTNARHTLDPPPVIGENEIQQKHS